MRLRKVKGALDYLKEKEEFVITNLNDFAISNYFKDNKPIHLEIGCGKGQFIINMAKTYPDISFIALEKYDSVLLRAIKKYEDSEEKPTNLIFILGDFNDIYDYLPKNKINTIYLNFSDPWPKNRQAKRRLTHVNFLNKYKNLLVKDGLIIQKTDNLDLFNFSLEQYEEANLSVVDVSLDLHKTNIFNIMTEYEEKKSLLGPIYYAKVKV